MLLFDAREIGKGPIVPIRMRFGDGNWVDAPDIGLNA